ncbi:MAG: hypothetical protein IPH06_03295 [Alphaproteobacteria bacterium]|nr:hypothetical protein [Alphaproteobacteria bacterium]QQS57065.1 MAG: hypothetical protein IPN28_12545 [Alphaproteobacteria bacterium]
MIDRFFYSPLFTLFCRAREIRVFNLMFFWLLSRKAVQRYHGRLAKRLAYLAYLKASRHCPAYRDFLEHRHFIGADSAADFSSIPETQKEGYVKAYSTEQRCHYGRLPNRGVVIDESSGSGGVPTNWVRGPSDRRLIKHLLQMSLKRTYPGQKLFIINCFVMGPWATGMNVSMSFSDVALLKSLGSDLKKLENTLKTFGPHYNYLILGYPPFIKLFVDTTTLNLKEYNLQLITGGESLSKGLEDYLSGTFKTMISSYGASDLDINMAVETAFSKTLRRLCSEHPGLCEALFGKRTVPMIFQCNPLDYYIERSSEGELIFTVTRLSALAPKIRYNLRDVGGVLSVQEVFAQLKSLALEDRIEEPQGYFPLLYVYGRGDQTVLFLGVNISISDMDTVLHGHKELYSLFHSFQMSVFEDEKADSYLRVSLELKEGVAQEDADRFNSGPFIFEALKAVNQEFRELSKVYPADRLVAETHLFETGPFADRAQRIKQKYIA